MTAATGTGRTAWKASPWVGRLARRAGAIAAVAMVCAATAGTAPAAAARGCSSAAACYRLAAGDTAALRRNLAPEYEVGLGSEAFGPAVGRPVAWRTVASWAAAHPVTGTGGTVVDQGYRLTQLLVRDGYAYVQFAPDGRITKLYLSTVPLPWD